MNKKEERDKKGRFTEGHKGSGGRPKGVPKDVICKKVKKGSVETLINDLLGVYATVGGEAFLKKWANANHRNLTKFIELLFKFAPPPKAEIHGGGATEIRVISNIPRIAVGDAVLEKRIKDLENALEERNEELRRFRSLDVQDVKVIEHEPILAGELPEHDEEAEIKAMSDEELERQIKREEEEVKK